MNKKELQEQLQGILLQARGIADEAEKAGRDFTAEEREQVARLMADAKGVKDQLKVIEGDEELKRQILDMGAGIELSAPQEKGVAVPAGKGLSLGARFADADAFKAWLKGIAPSGVIPESMKGIHSPPVEFKSLFKDLITGSSDTSAGAFVQPDYTGIYEPMGRRPRTLLDLISRRTTGSDLVEFVRQTAKVSQATPVAESNVTTYAGSTGEVSGEKPEGAVAFEKVQSPVKTIAVWIPATKRALSDAAQIRSIIDEELREDVLEDLEEEIYGGDGTGEHFTGITNTSGVLTQDWDTDLLTTTRKAKTALRTTGRSIPTAWVMNPADWEAIELLKDGENRYYYGGPINNGEQRLWGVPVVESEAVTEGVAILGNWRKAVLWDREQASIQVSDSHEDFFIRNMVAFLCEIRAAFGVIRPSAFIEVDLTAGS